MNHNPTPTYDRGSLHVAELARWAGVTPATVRYYARIDLLSPGREPENGYRRFSMDDLHRIRFIKSAQGLGLTIGDVKAIFETVSHGEVPCHQVKELVESRLHSIQERIAELQATESRITRAMTAWGEMMNEVPKDDEFCPLIERLECEEKVSVNGRGPCNAPGL